MQLHFVLLGPVVTEKATRLQEHNKHIFRIHLDATKIDVMNAIKTFYNAEPLSVRIVKMPKKTRRIGRSRLMTKRQNTKKAIVSLPAGQSLELINVKKQKAGTKEQKEEIPKETKDQKKKETSAKK